MLRIFSVLILMILSSNFMFAAFSVTNIISNEFPLVKVNFTATTPAGFPYQNLTINDFVVTENGKNMNGSLMIDCIESDEPAELSILLILDKSGSMDTNPEDGIRRWDWVVDGARKFIETLDFNGRTKVAVTTFSGINSVNLLVDFTNNKQELIDSIMNVVPSGPTYYNPPLLNHPENNAVKLLSNQPPDMSRICIFLTDGLPEVKEERIPEEITSSFASNNIQLYAITMKMPVPTFLSKICQDTGGKSFQVEEREELTEIYELIAIEVQKRQICELTWISDFGCDEQSRTREVKIDFKRDLDPETKDRTYIAPENSIARLVPVNGDLLSFGNPEINIKTGNSTTFTVENGPFTYNGVNFVPSTFFGIDSVKINGVLAKVGDKADVGDEIEVFIAFTQQDSKEFRQALFSLNGSYCPGYLNLVGGFSRVVLVTPHNGILSACEGVEIQWAGVEENVLVNLYYSIDNGVTWLPIVKNVSGGKYKWNPPFTNKNIKVKVERESSQSYRWVHQGKDSLDAYVGGLDMDKSETYVYVSGYYQKTIDFLGYTKVSNGGTDFFVTKLDKDGFPQWLINAGTSQNDSIAGVVTSDDNFIYVAGTTYQGLQFGTTFPFMQHPDTPYGFISKISPNGEVLKTISFGAKLSADNKVWVRGMRYEAGQNRIAVVGQYFKNAEFTPTYQLTNSGFFIAYYSLDLEFLDADRINYPLASYKKFEHTDSDDNIYSSHTFINNISFGNTTLTALANKDIAIAKYGVVKGTTDSTKNKFEVQKPELQFSKIQVDLGNVTIGESGSKIFTELLENTGDLIVNYKSNAFTNDPDEFTFQSGLPDELPAKSKYDLEFAFAPTALGPRTSTFTLNSECANPIKIELIGNGTCRGDSDKLVLVGKKTIEIRSRIVVEDIFTNPTSQTLRIQPIIELGNGNAVLPGEFEIFCINPSTGKEEGTLNVPPFSSATFVIYFTPKQEGIRTARINYGVDANCENTFSDLEGEGINSSIIGTAPNIVNRIRTVNKGKITLENLSDLNSKISDLRIVNDDEGYYKLIGIQSEYNIDGLQTIEVDYEFTPLTEGVFPANLEFTLATGKKDSTTELNGTGLNPNLSFDLTCPTNEAVQGQKSIATLRITNNSNLIDVNVNDITSLTNEYKFAGGVNSVSALMISKNSFRDVYIDYTPVTAGFINYDFSINADVAIGWLVDETFAADSSLPNLQGTCTAKSGENSSDNNFGNILICDKPGVYNYEIKNTSTNELIINKSDVIFNPIETAFELVMPSQIKLANGQTENIQIVFTPTVEKVYTTSISFVNNLGIDYTLNLDGKGVYINLNGKPAKTDLFPGSTNTDKFTFSASIDELANGNINWNLNEIKINVIHNYLVVNFLKDKINDLTGGKLTWTYEQVELGEFNLIGTGDLSTAFNGNLVSIDYYLMLADEFESDINYKISVNNCETSTPLPTTVKLSEFCLREGRILKTSGTSDNVNTPNPSPVIKSTFVDYSTAFDGLVKIEVTNMMGNVVATPVNQNLKAGYHNFYLNIDELSNGVYFINLQTAYNFKTYQLIINK